MTQKVPLDRARLNRIRNPNFLGGRLHHRGGELTVIKFWKSLFHRVRTRLLAIMPFTAIATSSTMAPRIEIYTTLACSIHRPEIFGESLQPLDILGSIVQLSMVPAVAHKSSSMEISNVFMIEKSLQIDDKDTLPTRKQRCASDPVVQAAVAKLTAGEYKLVFFLLCTFICT